MNSIVSALIAAILSLFGAQQTIHNPSAVSAPPALAAAAATSVEPAQPPAQHVITYTVLAGDTLSGIAESFSIPVSNLLTANDLSQRVILHPGEQLIIPNPQTDPATSEQTTLSQNVKSAEFSSPTNPATPTTNQSATSLLSTPAFDASAFVTRTQFDAAIAALGSSVQQLLAVSRSTPLPQYVAADGNAAIPYAAENNISNLSGVTITNANLTASEIPALNYFPSTSTISIAYGGTGISNSPTFGQLLLGNGAGGYNLVSTSSLGIVSGGGGGSSNVSTSSQNTWSALQIFAAGASTTQLSVFNGAWFGATATSGFNSLGQLTLANLTNSLLGVNANGQVFATTSIGTNLLSGTLGTIDGTTLSEGGNITVTAASSTLLANNNTWTGLQNFSNATSTLLSAGTIWDTGLSNALLGVNASGQVVSTSSIATNLLTGALGTINGTSLNAGGSIIITAASSTHLADNNTFSGHNVFTASTTFSNLININQASSSLTTLGTTWLSGLNNALLSTNGSGQVIATTSIGTNLLTGILAVVNGGTGVGVFGQGWIYSNGGTGALAASTSPTVNYLTATSTTATSTFAGNLSVAGNLNFNGSLLQNGLPLAGSQWTTSGSSISYTGGYVGIGTSSPATTLSVSGNGYITGGLGVGVANTRAGTLALSPAANSSALTISGYEGSATTSPITINGSAAFPELQETTISDNALTVEPLNVGPGSQSDIADFAGKQYIIYFTSDLHVHIAVRTLATNAITDYDTGFILPSSDDHFVGSIGIDSAGYIHIAYGMHLTSLIYKRSTNPQDPSSWTNGTMLGGTPEAAVQYPFFFKNPVTGTLYFTFTSMNGTGDPSYQYFYVYSTTNQTWSAAPGTGTGGVLIDLSAMSNVVYLNGPPKWNATGTTLWFSWSELTPANNPYLNNEYFAYWNGTNFFNPSGTQQTAPLTTSYSASLNISHTLQLSNLYSFSVDSNGVVQQPYTRLDANGTPQVYVAENST